MENVTQIWYRLKCWNTDRKFISLLLAIVVTVASLYFFLSDNNVTSLLQTSNVPADRCKIKCRDVSDVFSCRRNGTQDLSRLDFRALIRLRSGLTPSLISAKSKSRRVDKSAESDRRQYVVPNVVYYINFGDGLKFTLLQYISYVSVHKFIKPDYIFLYGNKLPKGDWWKQTLADVPNIYHVHVDNAKEVYGRKFHYPTQYSNLLRLRLLMGEIYLIIH